MSGFIGFAVVVAAIIMLLRFLRKREIEAFRDADIAALEDFRPKAKAGSSEPGSNVVSLPVAQVQAQAAVLTSEYELKPAVFDEVTRHVLERLEDAVAGKYRVLVDVPLTEFVRSDDKAESFRLRNRQIKFVLTPRHSLEVIAGVNLKGAGMEFVEHADFLKAVFRQIDRPLIEFPMVQNLSVAEIREQLETVLATSAANPDISCKRCGKSMTLRKVRSGRRAGKTYWVCPDYPTCNSIESFKS